MTDWKLEALNDATVCPFSAQRIILPRAVKGQKTVKRDLNCARICGTKLRPKQR